MKQTTMLTLLVALLTSSWVGLVFAQERNVTVVNTDPSITYTGDALNAPICKVNPDGTIVGSQSGCYNFVGNCTSSVTMGQNTQGNDSATFKFKGSGIYVNSALFSLSPIYTVTLDGEATDIDGFRDNGPLDCFPLFSRTGLDPTGEHTIMLSVKGPSPQSTTAQRPNPGLTFSLINFIVTEPESSNGSNNSAGTTTTPTTSPIPSTSADNSLASNKDNKSGAVAISVNIFLPIILSSSTLGLYLFVF